MTQGETIRPRTAMTTMNPMAYRPPRMSAQPSSPIAMSPGDRGVDRIEANVLL